MREGHRWNIGMPVVSRIVAQIFQRIEYNLSRRLLNAWSLREGLYGY